MAAGLFERKYRMFLFEKQICVISVAEGKQEYVEFPRVQ